MAAAKQRADKHEIKATQRASGEARSLAQTMPRLILEARRIAATVIHGLHGRKRAGPGENFWQYRRFLSGEPARRVDWRRSARDEHLYVREREWEAAHTVWLWPDRSPSMVFRSQLAQESKLDRCLVVAFALAEILVQAADRQPQRARQDGERDRARRRRAAQPAAAVCALRARRNRGGVGFLEPDDAGARHPRAALGNRRPRPRRADRRSGGRNLSLFRSRRVHRARGRGLHHRRPRRDLEGRIRDARRASPRGNPRRDRQARLELHHPSHRPASNRAAARAARASGRASSGRDGQRPPARRRASEEAGMIAGLPLGFAQPLVLLGLLSLPVLWWLLRLIPPQPRRIAFPPTRLLFDIAPREETPQRTPWWLTLLRLTLAALVIIAAAGPL